MDEYGWNTCPECDEDCTCGVICMDCGQKYCDLCIEDHHCLEDEDD